MKTDPQTTINCRVIPRREGRGFLMVKCDLNLDGECKFPLAPKPIPEFVWEWDGSIETPTIAPSIVCKMVGCGRHFTVTKGIPA